jgi:crotonobetainyl-CoA:carnitine CoA-transferase CaiB-like acyl-CoA transferase
MQAADGALEGLFVVDASNDVAGQFAARILADYGACVTLVEPPEGTATRRMPPIRNDHCVEATSYLYDHLNTGKRVMRLALDPEVARGQWNDLIGSARLLITNGKPPASHVQMANPGVIVCESRDFADSGPYAGWTGCEMIHQALSGLMYATGRAEHEPLYGFGYRAYYSAGAALAVAAMAALLTEREPQEAPTVAINVHETNAAMSQNLVAQYSYNHSVPRRGVYAGPCETFQCVDGWVVIFCWADRWRALCQAFDAEELGRDPAYGTSELLVKRWREATARLAPTLLQMHADEVVARAQDVKVMAARVLNTAQVLACEHLSARGFWEQVKLQGRRRKILGPIFRMSRTPRSLGSSLEQDRKSEAVANTSLESKFGKKQAPLAGLRVLELATAWSGPMAARILAWLGAEVIKVESPRSMDSWRGPNTGGEWFRYPADGLGERPYNRNAWFNSQNHNKLSLGLDLKMAEARSVISRLVKTTDVIVSNFSTGVLERLGLGYEAASALKPDIIVLEMSAMGEGGPMSGSLGVGPTMEALVGFPALTGYGDGVPQRTGPAYVDPIGALSGAVGVLIAIYERRRSGKGQRIELAQREGLMHWLGEQLLCTDDTGVVQRPRANAVDGLAPHGAFRAQGDDEWIAIAVQDRRQWVGLCDALGASDLAKDARFATVDGRLAHAAELRLSLEAYTSRWSKHALAALLQARGVCAAPICTGEDIHDDPQLAALGFYFEVTHPEAGRHRYSGLPFHLGDTVPPSLAPAPRLGEHTRRIMESLLGYESSEIDALSACGAAFQASELA